MWPLPVRNLLFLGKASEQKLLNQGIRTIGDLAREREANVQLWLGEKPVGDYFGHWIEMGKILGDKAPKIFNVNWFRLDEDGKFMWPGFGDNFRVLEWIIKRCEGKADAVETPSAGSATATATMPRRHPRMRATSSSCGRATMRRLPTWITKSDA